MDCWWALAESPHSDVRLKVAGHDGTPTDVLEFLATDQLGRVAEAARDQLDRFDRARLVAV